MTEPWLTKREIASALKVAPRTIERLRVPAMRVGGQNRYRLSEVECFMRADPRISKVGNSDNVIRFPNRKVPA